MAQYARPDLVVAAGSWVDSDEESAPSHLVVDETTANTSDYVMAEDSGSGSGTIGPLKFSLSDVTDPGVGTGHVLKVHAQLEDLAMMGSVPSLTYALYDTTVSASSGLIATKTYDPADGTWAENTIELNPTQANTIEDYSALQLWLTLVEGASSGSSLIKVAWAVFECPDASGGGGGGGSARGGASSGLSGMSALIC